MSTTLTQWGTLTLAEDPPLVDGAKKVPGPVSEKVPRHIALRGNSHYLGRMKRSPRGYTQTMIDLSHISSGHCRLFLRPSSGPQGVEAAVEDTSSNGTYVNDQKLVKKQTRSLQHGDSIFLYRAQSATPLGHTIMYRLDLDESGFVQAITEELKPVSLSKRTKGAGVSNANAERQKKPETSSPASARDPEAVGSSASGATGNEGRSALASANGNQPIVTGRQGSTPSAAMTPAAPMSTPNASNPPASSSEKSVLDLLGDQMALKKAAEEAARKSWEGEKERLVKQTRSLRLKLEASAEESQRLLTEKNGLQEQLAEAGARHESERAAREAEWEAKLKAAETEASTKLKEAVEVGNRQWERAEAAERAAEEANRAGQRRASELQSQVDALTEQKAQHQQRIAEIAARAEKLERTLAEVKQELADALVKGSSANAQLAEVRESEQSLRSRVTQQDEQLAASRQARAEVEGRLAQRERELEGSEKARKELEGCAQEVKRLSRELEEREMAGSRGSKELEQALSELDRERRVRTEGQAVRCKLDKEVVDLTTSVEGLKASLADAVGNLGSARAENVELTARLKDSHRKNRVTDAKLAETWSELERCRNRKDGVKGEAVMMSRNIDKAKQTAQEMSQSFKEQMAALLQHLEVPGGYLQLDSQVGPGTLGMLDMDDASSETEHKADADADADVDADVSPASSNCSNRGGVESGEGGVRTTQMSPSEAAEAARGRRGVAHEDAKARLFPSGGGDDAHVSGTLVGSNQAGLESGEEMEVDGSETQVAADGEPGKGTSDRRKGTLGAGDNEDGDIEEASDAENTQGEEDGEETDSSNGEGEEEGEGKGTDGEDNDDGRQAVAVVEGAEVAGIGMGGKPSGREDVDLRRDAITDGDEEEGPPETIGDCSMAITMRRISSSTRLEPQELGDGEEDEGETEFTVPPLDFGCGARDAVSSPGVAASSSGAPADGEDVRIESKEPDRKVDERGGTKGPHEAGEEGDVDERDAASVERDAASVGGVDDDDNSVDIRTEEGGFACALATQRDPGVCATQRDPTVEAEAEAEAEGEADAEAETEVLTTEDIRRRVEASVSGLESHLGGGRKRGRDDDTASRDDCSSEELTEPPTEKKVRLVIDADGRGVGEKRRLAGGSSEEPLNISDDVDSPEDEGGGEGVEVVGNESGIGGVLPGGQGSGRVRTTLHEAEEIEEVDETYVGDEDQEDWIESVGVRPKSRRGGRVEDDDDIADMA